MKSIKELIVDNFAGGGGASTGIELAIGRPIDIAVNHDPAAIAMYKANHHGTKVYCENVWEVNPVEATKGQPVALCWFSPDCKHFSKAKGGKPVEKSIRGLAWVAVKWAKQVHPRVIMLENVEEFKTWGPLLVDNMPDPAKKGETFNLFVKALKRQGYKVEYRKLRACDYGAPTSRKRFFLIARCDGKPIIWPEPTHGDPDRIEVRFGLLKPYRTAAECIDWSIPCLSIFDRKKPLAENTLKRIAKGIEKYVLNNPKPFIVPIGYGEREGQTPRVNSIEQPLSTVVSSCKQYLVTPTISQIGQTGGGDRLHDIQEPLSTIVSKAEHILVSPTLIQYHSETAKSEHRGQLLEDPIMTLDGSNRYGLVAAFMTKYFGGYYEGCGNGADEPVSTLTTKDRVGVVTSHLLQMNNHCDGRSMNEPIPTIVAGPGHWGEVRTFLMSYYGNKEDIGQGVDEPLRTITSKDRFGIVTIHGQDYQIIDIGMRMLEPKELYAAQGFPQDYIIDRDFEGKPYPKTAQVARCGNSVPPPFSNALVEANLPELCGITTDKEVQYVKEN